MPQIADFDVADFDQGNQQAGDEQLLVKFFVKPRPDKAATLEEGRPVFKDVEYVDIKIPGNRTGGACRPASPADKLRFARHYAAFQQRMEAPLEGTPLAEWPMVTRSQVEELAFHNIKTVEHLAELSDTHASNFMGINALKTKAKQWLEQAAGAAPAAKLQAELAERDERIATMQKQIDHLIAASSTDTPSLTSELDEPEAAPKPKRRSRRKKVVDDGTVQVD